MTVQSPGGGEESSSIPPEETATGELAITPEPFTDPLEPATVSGAVVVEERTLSGGILEIGDTHARVQMDVFLHPLSPYARSFQALRTSRLLPYIESGEVRVRFFLLDIQTYGGAADATHAIMCAGREGKGYATLNLLHRDGRTTLATAALEELGLDPVAFASCMKEQIDDPLAASHAEATHMNVTLVPTYSIDETVFVGLPTEADLLGALRAVR